ncbi:MAG: DNA mismatch repair endonuclease MutL [Chlamydiales bacterium]|nr:DNA mismatch repair endonuclease MutL [Chlamydiales bacterium]
MSEQRIRLLNETTINQIAAGEVIENPASVVKELVENSLDSGALSVSIETRGSGRALIRVSDNGCGMSHDDLLLALERHATSKLTEIEDLDSLATLGFRGEALPSIASVSKVSIHSANREEGHELRAEAGRILDIRLKPRQQGTTVEVKSLFFNVPVRKKFQKSVGSDRSDIRKVLTNMALCHPQTGFSWISDGEEQFSLPADASLQERIPLLLGELFAEGMLPVEHCSGSLQLSGFIGRPSLHRPNRGGQYLFINGRGVLSPFVSQCILEGYGTRLSTHRYPLFVLHLSLPPSLIDVNVHPQKREVRLRAEKELGSFILEAVDRSFNFKREAFRVEMPAFSASEERAPYTSTMKFEKLEEPSPFHSQLFPFPHRVILRLGKYFFVEDPEGIRVVDIDRARMRVAYEQLFSREGKKAVQHLLIPIQIEVTETEKSGLIDNIPFFEERGFSIRHFGGNTFIVDAIPSIFEGEEVSAFFHRFLEEGGLPREKRISLALKKTVRAPGREGGEALIEALFKCAEPDHTPNGKLIHKLLNEKEMAKFFDG